MHGPWSLDLGAMYDWLRGADSTPPVVSPPRKNGAATTNIPKMDGLH